MLRYKGYAKSIIHQQLIFSTERIRDLHRSMQAHSSAIPAAEMEVFLARCKLYELALQLNYRADAGTVSMKWMPNIAEMRMNTNSVSTPLSLPTEQFLRPEAPIAEDKLLFVTTRCCTTYCCISSGSCRADS